MQKSLQALGVPPRSAEAAGHAVTEHSACFSSATSLFTQTLGLQRENSTTELQEIRETSKKSGKVQNGKKKEESININRDKID